MSIINATPLLAAAGGDYQISRSVRLRSSASAYFSKTLTTPTSRQKITFSFWAKVGSNSTYGDVRGYLFDASTSGSTIGAIYLNGGLSVWEYNAGTLFQIYESATRRDPSAWYHFVVVIDTTLATSTDRVQIWCNGVRSTVAGTQPSQNYNLTYLNTASAHNIGKTQYRTAANEQYDGLLAEINFIDGQALTPSSFGETDSITGVWKPKKYAGTYGTNGFYLNFSDNSAATAAAIGKDYSGNGNNWTPNNISVTAGVTYDSMLDSPTPYADGGNGRGNYCVLNPLDSGAVFTVSGGNINATSTASNYGLVRSTIGIASGKFYWEVTINTGSGADEVGICTQASSLSNYIGSSATGWSYFRDGTKVNNNTNTAYGASYTTGDVIGVALDADSGSLTFYKNNTSQGTAFSGLASQTYFPAIGDGSNSAGVNMSINFGQRPFSYTPPTGYKALNTLNLPDPNITNGAQVMAATTWTGNGNSTVTVANGGNNPLGLTFQPDFVWAKRRDTTNNHQFYDAVRGAGYWLGSNSTSAEVFGTSNSFGYLNAFTSTGFSAAAGTSDTTNFNANGGTYVAWQWKANGAGSSNTSGSITSTVSVNATAGFSVVTYTGNGSASATVGHGLGVVPNMVIVKQRSAVNDWWVKHSSLGSNLMLILDSTSATYNGTLGGGGGIADLTSSSTFGFVNGTSNVNNVNASGGTFVAYCWAAVAGYSAFGSYTGNGSADGPFIYCGFRPRWIMTKSSSGVENWLMVDTSRDTYNPESNYLKANASDAEASATILDVLSNGFKLRTTGGPNTSSGTYIYAAFAENPFKNSLAR